MSALTINTNIVWAFGLCLHYFIQNPELRGFWISFFPFLLWGIHWCLIADVFYPLKKMLPFISACISAMGWFVRLMGLFILYDIFFRPFLIERKDFLIVQYMLMGLYGVVFIYLLIIKLKQIKKDQPFPIACGYQTLSLPRKIVSYIQGCIWFCLGLLGLFLEYGLREID